MTPPDGADLPARQPGPAVTVREATLADVDQLTEVHTLARTTYYTAAGGLDPADPSLSSPEAYSERRTA
ncbi:hypothetical protein [Micromonospora sp. NBC_01813]|uniref:hypothetical protein n=1 Tax=Micromonospora sp. NBC_01813 TaxID=2975988 RepID=UPI002DDBDAC6|nr:hypothetical protein [Micromonospora sp. NBC_01813]WSA08747.1 hypothetical protein OG958_32025 [Micromonospora sp. NBC_01813]